MKINTQVLQQAADELTALITRLGISLDKDIAYARAYIDRNHKNKVVISIIAPSLISSSFAVPLETSYEDILARFISEIEKKNTIDRLEKRLKELRYT